MNKRNLHQCSATVVDSTESGNFNSGHLVHQNVAQDSDKYSVGTRVSWGAIFAGASVALGMYFFFNLLGAAVGLSIGKSVETSTLTNGAIIWVVATTCLALFIGGILTSLLTSGENKVEAALYGIILWAVLLAFFVIISAAGVQTGFNALADLSQTARASGMADNWEQSARQAGLTNDQIEKWRETLARSPESVQLSSQSKAAIRENATRITWYAFAGLWLSMMMTALGAVVGAGPTFRQPTVRVATILETPSR